MKKLNQVLSLAVLAVVVFSACKKEETEPVPLITETKTNLLADPTTTGNHFAFFSLERNEEVALADSASNKWDIAFRSTTILTNGGTSGTASGGAFVQRAVIFDTYTEIPQDSSFKTDVNTTPAYAIPTGSGNGWYNYDFSTNIISPIPGNILIIRTASGNYAKVEILSYYKDAPVTPSASDIARYYTFRYIYQPDGTKIF